MEKILSALKQYLESKSYQDLYLDRMPKPEESSIDAISLIKWEHTIDKANDGTGTHFVQIQVRRSTYEEAYNICHALFQLLDSGEDETVINLTNSFYCIGRPQRGPLMLAYDPAHTTFYCEIAFWGKN